MKERKTGTKVDHSQQHKPSNIVSLSTCMLSLLDGVDKITKVKDESLRRQSGVGGRINYVQLCR